MYAEEAKKLQTDREKVKARPILGHLFCRIGFDNILEAGDPLGGILFVVAKILSVLFFQKIFFIRRDEIVKKENAQKNEERDQRQSQNDQE